MKQDMKSKKSKWIMGGICLLICVIIVFVYVFREPILFKAGCFMAPVGDHQADVAILEGSDFISTGIITIGVDLLSSGKVKSLVVVLQNIAPSDRPYGINGNYADIVRQKLKNLGLKEIEFKVIAVPVRNPITLNEAKVVLQGLSKKNIKSAILVSSGFHTRRSYLVYQHVGIPLQIKIFPHASFTTYTLTDWLVEERGVRDFAIELSKLGYYWARGYIPLKFSYSRTEVK